MSEQNVSAVERALIILDAFTDRDADLSLKDPFGTHGHV